MNISISSFQLKSFWTAHQFHLHLQNCRRIITKKVDQVISFKNGLWFHIIEKQHFSKVISHLPFHSSFSFKLHFSFKISVSSITEKRFFQHDFRWTKYSYILYTRNIEICLYPYGICDIENCKQVYTR